MTKSYDEALERAKECLKDGTITNTAKSYIEIIFPELKESEDEKVIFTEAEDDVRRRSTIQVLEYARSLDTYNQYGKANIDKNIAWLEKQGSITKLSEEEQNRFAKGILTSCALSFIDYLDAHKYEGKMCVSNGECEDIENAFHNAMWDRLHRYYCKYIEKQGEQKIADKIGPKFHEGDFIKHNKANIICKVISVNSGSYYVKNIKTSGKIELFNAEQNFHLWTIQDAKDGDVLCYETENDFKIFIYKNGHIHYHCCYNNGHLTTVDSFFVVEKYLLRYIHPATEEERNLLFAKMKDADYKWNNDEKKKTNKPRWRNR